MCDIVFNCDTNTYEHKPHLQVKVPDTNQNLTTNEKNLCDE